MLAPVVYKGSQAGPKLLVLGAVHGNEKCGTAAITRVIAEIKTGAVKIAKGQVTFVPICNPRAYEKDTRFTERNLNRYLVPTENSATYEAELGNELCPLIAACDALLDIHSYTAGGAPFVFIGGADERERAFGSCLGAAALLTGWEQAYAKTGRRKEKADKNEGVGTTEYARRQGAIAVTLECGQHKAPESPEIAYRAIHNALAHFGLIENAKSPPASDTQLITVTHVYYRDDAGSFPKNWKHLDKVAKGELFAYRADGGAIHAPQDGYMIMPRPDCPLGEEWFYFGEGKTL
jgi:predicted deacylase